MAESFEEAIRQLGYGEAPERRLTRAEVSALARQLSEREGIKYKSARRRIERRRTTGAESRGQPNRAFARRVFSRGLDVHVRVKVKVSREQPRPRSISVHLPTRAYDAFQRMANALDRADLDSAETWFWSAVFREYEEAEDGEPAFMEDAEIVSIDQVTLAWGGAGGGEPEEIPF